MMETKIHISEESVKELIKIRESKTFIELYDMLCNNPIIDVDVSKLTNDNINKLIEGAKTIIDMVENKVIKVNQRPPNIETKNI